MEKHGTRTRRSWRKLHIGLDADTGETVASALTGKDVDDGSQVPSLRQQIAGPVASITGDGAYDASDAYTAAVAPPRSTAVESETAQTNPTQRDGHLRSIAELGRIGWQKVSGYNKRARVETTIERFKQVIGDRLRSHDDGRQQTETAVAIHVLNRMLGFGRPDSVCIR